MIPARNRIKDDLQRGFYPLFRGKCLNIKSRKNQLGYSRFAILISKKFSTRAVRRNALKRKIYNYISSQKDIWNNQSFAYDFLIIVTVSETQLEKDVKMLEEDLQKLFIINV